MGLIIFLIILILGLYFGLKDSYNSNKEYKIKEQLQNLHKKNKELIWGKLREDNFNLAKKMFLDECYRLRQKYIKFNFNDNDVKLNLQAFIYWFEKESKHKLNNLEINNILGLNNNFDSTSQTKDIAENILINTFRNYLQKNDLKPILLNISDNKIVDIYYKVCQEFKTASKIRNEHISSGNLNMIVLKFLQLYITMGDVIFQEHLQFEISKYLNDGLRKEYQNELKF
jgi:hypothetical protein